MGKLDAVGVAVLLLANVLATPARSETAIERGKNVFKLCQACHSLEADVTIVGPSLHGLFKRRVAADDSFSYSDALAGTDFVWDAERLSKWLADPARMIPGNKMLFPGIKDSGQISDLIIFLKEATR